MENKIIIKNLTVEAQGVVILRDINMEFKFPGINLLHGENGTGKSTLFHTICNDPNYNVISGEIIYYKDEKQYNLLELKPNEIFNLNIFLSFQTPVEIPGLSLRNFLITIYKEKYSNEDNNIVDLSNKIEEYCDNLELKKELLDRDLNKNYSGGEKKKVELLQILLLKPDVMFLDEIDTGIDVKSLNYFLKTISDMKDKGIIIITHNESFLNQLEVKYNLSI